MVARTPRWSLALLVVLAAVAARGAEPRLRSHMVRELVLELPPGIAPELIGDLIEIREGERFSRAAVRRSVERLFHLDLFSEVRVFAEERPGGLRLTVVCRPKQRIRDLRFTGNERFSDARLGRLLRVTPGDEFILEQIERRVEAVQLAYRRAGYHFARVLLDAEVTDPERNEVVLHGRIIEWPPLEVSRVVLSGRLGLSEEELRDTLEVAAGDILDLDLLERDREALLELFRDQHRYDAQVGEPVFAVGPDRRTAEVRFQIDAGPRVEFQFVGQREVSPRDLREVLTPEREEQISPDVIDGMARKLREYCARLGYLHVEVTGRRERRGPERAVVIFTLNEGTRVRLSRIRFTGNTALEDDELQEIVEEVLDREIARPVLYQPVDPDLWSADRRSGAPRGPSSVLRDHLSLLPGRQTYVAEDFRRGLEEVERAYLRRGFLEVALGEPVLEFSASGERLTVTVPITEGPRTTVASVEFFGAGPLEVTALREAISIMDGAGLDRWAVEAGRLAVRNLCRRRGHYFCRVETEFERRPGAVPVRVHLQPGPRVQIGQILVRGNIRTERDLVVDRLAVRTGDLLRREDLARSRQRLMRTGLFYEVSVAPFDPEHAEPVKNLVVQVRERPDSVFEVAGGASSEKGPFVRVRYEELNLFGRGVRAGAGARANFQIPYELNPELQEFLDALPLGDRLEREIDLGVSYPYLLVARQFQLGTSMDLSLVKRENELAYGRDSDDLVVSLFTDPTERIAGNVQFQITYEFVELASEVLPHAPQLDTVTGDLPPSGVTWSYGPRLQLVLDFRDDRFDPVSGVLATLRGEYKGSLVGEQEKVNFLKGEALFTGYIPLHRASRLRLAVSVRAGALYNFLLDESGIESPVQDRFFLGGRGTLRSLPESSLYPADLTTEEIARRNLEVSEGGNLYLLAKAELRRPLIWGFELGAFVDVGNLWLSPDAFTADPFALRYAAGLGLRYTTPVGPVAFDYGFNLDRRRAYNEPFGAFHFSIGIF